MAWLGDPLAQALLGPLLAAVLVLLLGRWPNLRDTSSVVVGLGTFGVVAGRLTPEVYAGGRPRLELGEVLPGLPLVFELEPLGVLFALVASGLWVVTTVYAVGYLRGHHEVKQTRFFTCFAAAIFGALGVAFAGNVFTLFVFYELITLSTFPLVTHHGTEKAKRAGRTYLGILMGTSVAFLLFALVWTHWAVGHTEFTPGGILAGKVEGSAVVVLFLLYAFGTGKAALMPFHRWLPAAMVAPTPVSALLHAVAVVKAGVFTVLKVSVYVFGYDALTSTGAGAWVAGFACATLLIASIIALRQDNLKRRLAYSTISQLAYIVLGAALANPVATVGAALHIATHALGKITLFFCAGSIYVVEHKSNISQLKGLAWRMPWTTGAFLGGSLAVIGIPPFALSNKFGIGAGGVDAGHPWAVWIVMLGSLLAIGYLMPVVVTACTPVSEEDPAGPYGGKPSDLRRAPLLVVPLVLTATGTVLLFVYANPVFRLIQGALP